MAGLDRAVENGEISVYYRRVIIDMSKSAENERRMLKLPDDCARLE